MLPGLCAPPACSSTGPGLQQTWLQPCPCPFRPMLIGTSSVQESEHVLQVRCGCCCLCHPQQHAVLPVVAPHKQPPLHCTAGAEAGHA
jgi:hypothetical protein